MTKNRQVNVENFGELASEIGMIRHVISLAECLYKILDRIVWLMKPLCMVELESPKGYSPSGIFGSIGYETM